MGLGRVALATVGLISLGAIAPATAAPDGLPVSGIDAGRSGVTDGDSRYVSVAARRNTLIARIEVRGGEIERSRLLRGRFTVPAVAYDGSADGLSADGGTLVLIRPRFAFPRERTTFAVIDADSLRLREVVTLRDDFSFDAISPDGRTMYLVHYLSRRDSTDYEVRAFDLAAGRLLPDPIVDPEEPEEDMGGLPITRASSPDGRWAYTLYQAGEPFIHALDTTGRTAVCIDLPQLEPRQVDLGRIGLDVGKGGEQLTISNQRGRPLLLVDTESFDVTKPEASSPSTGEVEGDTGQAWVLIAAGVVGFALALIAGGAVARGGRRRRQDERAEQELPADPESLEPAARE
jgi:hypothetical protein